MPGAATTTPPFGNVLDTTMSVTPPFSASGHRQKYRSLLSASASVLSEPGVGPRSVLTPMAASASAEVLPTYSSTMRYVRTSERDRDPGSAPEPLSTSHSYSTLREGFSRGDAAMEGSRGRLKDFSAANPGYRHRGSAIPYFPWAHKRLVRRYRIKPERVVAEIDKYERALRSIDAPYSLVRYEVEVEEDGRWGMEGGYSSEEEDGGEEGGAEEEEEEEEEEGVAGFPSWARTSTVEMIMGEGDE